MTASIGQSYKGGIKKSSSAWGGVAMLLGSGDGFEFNSSTMKANIDLIRNTGLVGVAFQRSGSPGNIKPSGDWNADLYYDDAVVRMLAGIIGDDVPTNLTGAYDHDMALQSSHTGIYYTVAALGDIGNFEWNTAKITSLKISGSSDGDGQRVKIMPTFASHDENLNVGSPSAAFVVAATQLKPSTPSAFVIRATAALDFIPSPISITKVAGITAIAGTIKGEDRFGDATTINFTQTDFAAQFYNSAPVYLRRVISAAFTSATGAGTISFGVNNGINNATTAASVTTGATRFPVLFSQMRMYVSKQDAADFSAADELCISGFEININLNMDSRVNSCTPRRIAEPMTGGAGFAEVTLSFNFDEFATGNNRQRFFDMYSKDELKAKLVFSGPQIGATAFNHALTIYLNAIQVEGEPSISGAGLLKWDFTGTANQALASPTGFPAATTMPLRLVLRNVQSADYLA